MKQDFQDRIDDYILGRMNAEERLQFEEEIKLNDEKREQFIFTTNLKNAISSRQEKLTRVQMMRERLKTEDNNTSNMLICASMCDDAKSYDAETKKQAPPLAHKRAASPIISTRAQLCDSCIDYDFEEEKPKRSRSVWKPVLITILIIAAILTIGYFIFCQL